MQVELEVDFLYQLEHACILLINQQEQYSGNVMCHDVMQ